MPFFEINAADGFPLFLLFLQTPVRDSTFTILRDLILQKTGLFYSENKKDLLADKLFPRLAAYHFDSFLDYYYLLKYDAADTDEWFRVMDQLSVPETYFWREFDQIELLSKTLLSAYFKQYHCPFSSRPIAIWSAACATGEEPLSIAIALQEAHLFEQIPIQIYASDASVKAIEQAKKGIYRRRSFRTLSPYLQEKYFTKQDDYWQISPDIHRHIRWEVANLSNPVEIHRLSQATFIFCRNVFIYFSEQAIKKTVEQFYNNMTTPGYLFVSASESLLQLNTHFELQTIDGAFVYVKQ